jgi:mandelate racemase
MLERVPGTLAGAEVANLKITRFRVRAVDAPFAQPFATASGVLKSAPLALMDLETREGVVGRAYVFVYTPMLLGPLVSLAVALGEALAGSSVAPLAIDRGLQARFRLVGAEGLTGMAAALIDMAAWDALGQSAGLPLVSLLGEAPRPVAAYHGLGLLDPDEAERQAAKSRELGFSAVKLKVGHERAAADVDAVRAAKTALGENGIVMADYNQSLTVPEAIRRARALEEAGVFWIEEPVFRRDLDGQAKVARAIETPVQAGENWWGLPDMQASIAAGASDLVMLDAMKIGGVTGWLRAAGLAAAHGLPVSSHLFPEASAHLLAASATADWLEWQDWADPILREPIRPVAGKATPPMRPGLGLEWDEQAVVRYAA